MYNRPREHPDILVRISDHNLLTFVCINSIIVVWATTGRSHPETLCATQECDMDKWTEHQSISKSKSLPDIAYHVCVAVWLSDETMEI